MARKAWCAPDSSPEVPHTFTECSGYSLGETPVVQTVEPPRDGVNALARRLGITVFFP